jgi:phospholipase C
MRNKPFETTLLSTVAVLAVAATVASIRPVAADHDDKSINPNHLKTKTPIKHLVVVFNENRSFDHYFGFYPSAQPIPGEPQFKAAKNTPTDIRNLETPALLDNNPNLNPLNGVGASNPFRLDRTQANTASQNHAYTPEQMAYDNGKLDLFPLDVGRGTKGALGPFGTTAQTMGIFDCNTITALCNYAQNYAMSDNAWGDTYGPSTPGLLNMFAGQTNGAVFTVVPAGTPTTEPGLGQALLTAGVAVPSSDGSLTLINDIDPTLDVCSSPSIQVTMTSKNIGDLLNAANIPWGSFVGGFNLQTINENGTTGCARTTFNQVIGAAKADYTPHHIWFQYFASTANPTHARPSSTAAIGYTDIPGKPNKVDPANHAYDLADFETAVGSGNFPAVSFIKMAGFQDSHPGNSDPLSEQQAFVHLVNFLQEQPDWDSTAVILTYDDSDGWYDHAFAKPTRGSFSAADALSGTGNCGTPGVTSKPTGVSGQPVDGRCGPGTRLPFLVISPYAKQNYVSHVFITQASIPQFIEDNWLSSQRLGGGSFDVDPATGSIMDMFDFTQKKSTALILDEESGTVVTKSKSKN